MRPGQIILVIYALLLAAGGTIGYVKSGSKASLIAGCVLGVFVFLSALISFKDRRRGYRIGMSMIVIAFATFVVRLVKAGEFKWMPTGMFLILSAVFWVLMLVFTTMDLKKDASSAE